MQGKGRGAGGREGGRLWRDAKLLEIGGGTNEAHHKNMVRDLKKHHERLL